MQTDQQYNGPVEGAALQADSASGTIHDRTVRGRDGRANPSGAYRSASGDCARVPG